MIKSRFYISEEDFTYKGNTFKHLCIVKGFNIICSITPLFLCTKQDRHNAVILCALMNKNAELFEPELPKLRKVYRCHACKKRIRKNQTWCQHCGSNDEDE